MLTRRQFIAASLGTVTLGAGVWGYAAEIEPFWVQKVYRVLDIVGLPAGLVGKRLIQLSDVHVGNRVPDDFVVREFARVGQFKPDILVVTGDLTQSADPDQSRRVYSRLPRGTLGTFVVLGNHDYGRAWSELAKADSLALTLRQLGITVLRNEVARVRGLQVIGLDDLWGGRFDPNAAFGKIDPSSAALCLTHNPDSADLPGWDGFRGWILAGHTHGGQCNLPLVGPPRPVVNNRRYIAGEYELSGGRRMYINRGLGFANHYRFLARPEITIFELAASH